MSEKTNIAWCQSTWSPWMGCRRVSPGCQHCYIEFATPLRVKGIKHGGPRQRTSESYWKQPLKWNRDAERRRVLELHSVAAGEVHQWQRPRIFPSLCDWLDDEVPIEWLADFLKLIHDTPNLDWLLLTKRPQNWNIRAYAAMDNTDDQTSFWLQSWAEGKPPKNVWIGVSVEDQKRADERIPLLLQIPAKVRFLSVEPLLEKVNLELWVHAPRNHRMVGTPELPAFSKIDWVIVGGESGSERRDRGTEAICDVARQCVAAGIPCFVKQASAFKPGERGDLPDWCWALKQFPHA